MDFLIPEDYIILSSNVDYSQNERLQNTTDFILYVVDDYYDPTQAITEMETVLNCSYEYEWLFVRGYSRVLLIHKE